MLEKYGFNELMKVMTAKGNIPINFDGTINKLRTLGEGKVSEDYLRFVESLTPEQLQDKELMNQMGIKTKKGKVTGIDKEKQQKNIKKLRESKILSSIWLKYILIRINVNDLYLFFAYQTRYIRVLFLFHIQFFLFLLLLLISVYKAGLVMRLY